MRYRHRVKEAENRPKSTLNELASLARGAHKRPSERVDRSSESFSSSHVPNECTHTCKKQATAQFKRPNERSRVRFVLRVQLVPISLVRIRTSCAHPPSSSCQKRRTCHVKFTVWASSAESRVSRSHERMCLVPRPATWLYHHLGTVGECTRRYLAVVLSDGITIKSRLSFKIFPHFHPNMMVVRQPLSARDYANSICSFSGFQR
jgi:hypothetical protein